MSSTIITELYCDICDKELKDFGSSDQLMNCIDPKNAQIAEARRIAKELGWTYEKHAGHFVDLCPNCNGTDKQT